MRLVLLALFLALTTAARAATPEVRLHDRTIITSDKVRLHLIEGGPATGHTLLFIPGWAMPAWIWEPQLEHFARHFHVVALDPRGQGKSDIPATGYEPIRRGKDIAEVIGHLEPVPVTIVAWSLGVLDTLAYIHTHDDRLIAGLVLVDNSVGEEPPPVVKPAPPSTEPPPPYDQRMRRFVHAMFHQPQPAAWLDRLTGDALHLPEPASRALLAYPLPRSYWKEAVYATAKPLLYVIRPRWSAQAENLQRNRPGTEVELFTDAGHALFADEPRRFNAILDSFLRRRIWP